MNYVDGYVLPVPKSKLSIYRKFAQKASKIWCKHGALEFRECVGDDLNVQSGVSFPKQIKTKPGETVVMAWIVYKSKAHRDQVNARAMKDPRIADLGPEPFDSKRVVSGGFKVLVEA